MGSKSDSKGIGSSNKGSDNSSTNNSINNSSNVATVGRTIENDSSSSTTIDSNGNNNNILSTTTINYSNTTTHTNSNNLSPTIIKDTNKISSLLITYFLNNLKSFTLHRDLVTKLAMNVLYRNREYGKARRLAGVLQERGVPSKNINKILSSGEVEENLDEDFELVMREGIIYVFDSDSILLRKCLLCFSKNYTREY